MRSMLCCDPTVRGTLNLQCGAHSYQHTPAAIWQHLKVGKVYAVDSCFSFLVASDSIYQDGTNDFISRFWGIDNSYGSCESLL